MSAAGWLPERVRAEGAKRSLKSGQMLFRMGQRPTGLYEIVSGRVRLVRLDARGRETVLFTAAAGDTLAEASLFSPAYHCDAVAVTDAVVRLYPRAAVIDAIQRDPKVAQAFMAMMAREIMSLRTRLERRNIHSARERIRHYLGLHADPKSRTVVLSGTLKDLAVELGITHEALYRTLRDMAADGEIERRPGRIRLLRAPV